MKASYHRPLLKALTRRLAEPRRFIQVLAGPRQTGKTTLARQAERALKLPVHMTSADEPTLRDRSWLHAQWEIARLKAAESGRRGALLILDEVQKLPDWSEAMKRLWDEDTASGVRLKVLLLGSSPLLIQRGLSESLAGRFEMLHATHWSFEEMRDAFGFSLDQFLFHGGYPGAAPLVRDRERWARYINDSLIETTLSRDILLLSRVDKPALLRRLFQLGCEHSGQILAYQKMLGQLHDAGNTTTLAHYLDLLGGAGMLTGLHKHAGSRVRQRASSPKLLVLNTALMSATSNLDLASARKQPEFWGRLVESAAGAHLVNTSAGSDVQVEYWRESSREVDYVLRLGKTLVALEIKSGRRRDNLPGLEAFRNAFHPKRTLLIGGDGIPLEEFFLKPAGAWLG